MTATLDDCTCLWAMESDGTGRVHMASMTCPARPHPRRTPERPAHVWHNADEFCAGCGRPWTPGRRCRVGGTCWVER